VDLSHEILASVGVEAFLITQCLVVDEPDREENVAAFPYFVVDMRSAEHPFLREPAPA
jgi:hypothetical protein